MNVVILNGPPGSGKDTLARIMSKVFNSHGHYMFFKEALYKESVTWLNEVGIKTTLEKFVRMASDEINKEYKCYPQMPSFYVKGNDNDTGSLEWSPRMVLQHVSENIIKPKYGNDFFGIKALEAMENIPKSQVVIFSDGGFVDEINSVASEHKTIVINLSRRGKSFGNDSRNYVKDSNAERHIGLINGVLSDTCRELAAIIVENFGIKEQKPLSECLFI